MERITKTHLQCLARRLNVMTKSPTEYKTGDRINVGHWHISCAYGGFSLVRTANESGGESQPMGHAGHTPARDLYERIHAFIRGIEFAREGA